MSESNISESKAQTYDISTPNNNSRDFDSNLRTIFDENLNDGTIYTSYIDQSDDPKIYQDNEDREYTCTELEGNVHKACTHHSDGSEGHMSEIVGTRNEMYFRQEDNSTREALNKIYTSTVVAVLFMIIELTAGYYANSLALMADAAHLMSDIGAFLLSAYSIHHKMQKGTDKYTFGGSRMESIGAIISVLFIWGLTFFLVKESIYRIFYPRHDLKPEVMLVVGTLGLASNMVMTYLLGGHTHFGDDHGHSHGHGHGGGCGDHVHVHDVLKGWVTGDTNAHDEGDAYKLEDSDSSVGVTESINVRAAYIHALGDCVQNLGVILAGLLLMWRPQWTWIDPMCTMLFAVIVILTTVNLMGKVIAVVMAMVPESIDLGSIKADILDLPDVISVHDMHAWSITVAQPHFTCHAVIKHGSDARAVLRVITDILQTKYKILHTTVQIDFSANKISCNTKDHIRCHR